MQTLPVQHLSEKLSVKKQKKPAPKSQTLESVSHSFVLHVLELCFNGQSKCNCIWGPPAFYVSQQNELGQQRKGALCSGIIRR